MFGPIKRKPKEKEDPAEKKREQEENARVYAEFVKSFEVESDDDGPRHFIRGGVIDPNKTVVDSDSADTEEARLYKPSVKKSLWLPPPSESLQHRTGPLAIGFSGSGKAATSPPAATTTTTVRTELGRGIGGIDGLLASSAPTQSKGAREIDSFLEEIKKKQELLDQRKQLRIVATSLTTQDDERETAKKKLQFIEEQTRGTGSIPGVVESEETSNLYLGSLSPEITEEFLCQQFGKFGVITSVKIMYPRTDEERARARNCGFVSFRNRESSEAAKNALDGKDFFGMCIRIGWGKAISRPNAASSTPSSAAASPASQPILPFVTPPVSFSTSVPPKVKSFSGFSDEPPDRPDQTIRITVRVPAEAKQRVIIDVVAQYVAEEGHIMEQLIKEEQSNNSFYRFMFEMDSDNANYYRWRVYSFTQGDTVKGWRTTPFLMFQGCREWVPPGKEFFEESRSDRRNNFSDAGEVSPSRRPVDQISKPKGDPTRGGLSLDEDSRQDLEEILRTLTRDRHAILQAMAFCLDRSESAQEISECVMESLTIENTPVDTKIARLFLLSDILHNSSSSRQPAWSYRTAIERYLPEIFNHHSHVLRSLNGRLTIQAMKDRVMRVLRIWEDWAIYPPLFTKGLEASFLKDSKLLSDVFSNAAPPLAESDVTFDKALDGISLVELVTLSKYPFWIRKNVMEWNSLDLSHLETLCNRRGLSIRPEPRMTPRTEDVSSYEPADSRVNNPDQVEQSSEVTDEPSYFSMRQLLIRRMVEYEAYWRNKQIQNSRIFDTLDTDNPAPASPLPSIVSPALSRPTLTEIGRRDLSSQALHSKYPSNERKTGVDHDDDEDMFAPTSKLEKTADKVDGDINQDVSSWCSSVSQTAPPDRSSSVSSSSGLTDADRENRRQVEVRVMQYRLGLEKSGTYDEEQLNHLCTTKRDELIRASRDTKN